MDTLNVIPVYIRIARGKWHTGYRDLDTGNLATSERCNIDDATLIEEYPDLPEDVQVGELCRWCHGG